MLVEQAASDSALVEAVRAGDDTAFEELYRRYNRRISAFAYGFVRDEGRAEDLTQEAFLSALRRMRETQAPISFRPWIYEIARNAAIDLHRRSSRTEEVSIDEEGPLAPADRSRLVGSSAPENVLADKERLEHLCGAISELSETHHRILVLRELEGLSYREIGARMDLTAPAVESTLFRARRRLEHEYAEIDTGRRCASMRSVIARLAEGVELPRERRKLERHALRCSFCRRRARELGVDPLRLGAVVARAAALLPLPALLRRRLGDSAWTAAGGHVAEGGAVLAGKTGALLAAAALAGGGGATLGGVGPLAPGPGERYATPPAQVPKSAPAKPPAGRAGAKAPTASGRQTLTRRSGAPTADTSRPAAPAAKGPSPATSAPTAPRGGLPATPTVPSAEEALPPLKELNQPPPQADPGVSLPPIELPKDLKVPQRIQGPVGAVSSTAAAAVTGLTSGV